MSSQKDNFSIVVEGDLRGHIIGTVSKEEGMIAVTDAEITITGSTPLGPWTSTTTSGAHGYFQGDLPVGTEGSIQIAAAKDGQCKQITANRNDLATGLTPRPAADSGYRMPLDGEWNFVADPPETFLAELGEIGWRPIQVPSHWEMAAFVAESGVALYTRTFEIPSEWSGKRIKFWSDGIYSRAEIWLNESYIGSHDGGATSFELDVTGVAKVGQRNTIVIRVTEQSDAGHLDAMSYYAHINMAGIWRSLELFCVDPVHLSRVAVVTTFDDDYRDAELSISLDVVNEQMQAIANATLVVSVIAPDGTRLDLPELSTQLSLDSWGARKVKLAANVTHPYQWSAESPKLYRLQIALIIDGEPEANATARTIEQTFGFRQVEIRGRTYLLNNRPVRLWGTCHHDAHPLLGRAITPEIAKQDIELMKGASLNAFRTAHYPPHPALLDFADSEGMYVEDEAPLCFISVIYGPVLGRQRNLTEDLRLAPLAIRLSSELIERDLNHPSVVVWSQCNESEYGTILEMAREFIRQSDPTRPLSAGQSANLDIATYHCPTSMKRLADTAHFQMPVLFDEAFPVFQGIGTQSDSLEVDPGLRDYWIAAHLKPVQGLRQSEHQFGTMIWAWVDDAFLVPGKGIEYGRRNMPQPHFVDRIYKMPGRGITGDPPWGLIDGWRRPRPEWWLSKKIFSPIQIEEKVLARPEKNAPITVTVRNLNFFINLNQYRCRWQLASERGELRVDVPPQAEGMIEIVTEREPSEDDTLLLEFIDEKGHVVDGFRLPFKAYSLPQFQSPNRPAQIVEEPTDLSFASTIRMVGERTELAFDRTSGTLMRGIVAGQQVVVGGPRLHMVMSASTTDLFSSGWMFTNAESCTESEMAVLRWKGMYRDQAEGFFEMRMDDSGNIEIAYNFRYTGPNTTATEVGISFEVPLECDRFEWERRAEWSYYPEDHIGRPSGFAIAHPDISQTTPPNGRPFAMDDHPWGSNDFRSTKRNIFSASLKNAEGFGVKVLSDGRQHIRNIVQAHSISMNVLDYFGGVTTGTSEWDSDDYTRGHALSYGERIKGVVRLQLVDGKEG